MHLDFSVILKRHVMFKTIGIKKMQIKLKTVNSSDFRFLYELLKQRDQEQNISHKKMPKYTQHLKFVTSKPYSFWYIIIENGEKIGSVYLTTQNEIGMSLIKEKKMKRLEKNILELIMKKNHQKRFFVNISPKNKKLELLVKKFGFKIIQKTYEFERMSNEKN